MASKDVSDPSNPWARPSGSGRPAAPQEWLATEINEGAPTQVMRTEADAPADAGGDIGRLVGPGQRELFVSCGATEAMLQQIDVFHPEFIALHDLGCTLSKRFLDGVASAASRAVQTLTIRRQGYGNALATLRFVEWTSRQGRALRVYSTDVDADTATRHGLAQLLLAHSRLGVLMAGDLPAHAWPAALQPVRETMLHSAWPNRHLLVLPVHATAALSAQADSLGARGITVRVTPQIARPADAWAFLSSTWNRLREQLGSAGQDLPPLPSVVSPAPAPSAVALADAPAPPAATRAPPLPLRPMPEIPKPGGVASRDQALADHVQRVVRLKGCLSCTVFEADTGAPRAHAGGIYAAAEMAREGAAWLASARREAQALDMGCKAPELTATLDEHHRLLRPLPGTPGQPALMLHVVLDKHTANLTLARLQIERLDESLGF